MSPLPNTPRRSCELCRKTMAPRKGESKYGYERRRFCSDWCSNEHARRNSDGVTSALSRVVWNSMNR